MIYQLKHEGAFSDLGKLNTLLGTANQYLITDSTFNLLDFATDMRALNGQELSFITLPFTPENNVYVPASEPAGRQHHRRARHPAAGDDRLQAGPAAGTTRGRAPASRWTSTTATPVRAGWPAQVSRR